MTHFRQRTCAELVMSADSQLYTYLFILFSNKGPKGLLQVATKYTIIQCIHSCLHIHITHIYI